MPHGFYQLLGVSDDASVAEIEAAYNKELAALVRRLRSARQQGADVSILEGRERALREARAVLTDEQRRRRYDAFRVASDKGMPGDAASLWAQAAGSLVDPVAVSALRVVRTLTDLPVGEPFPGVAEPPPPVRMPPLPSAESSGRGSWPDLPGQPPPTPAAAGLQPGPGFGPGIGPGPGFGTGPGVGPSADAPSGAGSSHPRPGDVFLPDPQPTDAGAGSVPDLRLASSSLFDPLEELLADLSGTDPGIHPEAEPSDPIDRLARDFGYDGRFLEAVRGSRGLSIEDLAGTTRISARYLQALEANAYDQLPAATFVRGYLKEVVRVLELGDRDVVGGYMKLFHRVRG